MCPCIGLPGRLGKPGEILHTGDFRQLHQITGFEELQRLILGTTSNQVTSLSLFKTPNNFLIIGCSTNRSEAYRYIRVTLMKTWQDLFIPSLNIINLPRFDNQFGRDNRSAAEQCTQKTKHLKHMPPLNREPSDKSLLLGGQLSQYITIRCGLPGCPFSIMCNIGYPCDVFGNPLTNGNLFSRRRDCKKICVTGILTNLLKGQQNAIIRRTHRPTAGGLLQP